MRRLLAALLLALLIPSLTFGASAPPPGLAGTLAIVSQDATSVTLHAEQTGGDLVTLTIKHSCYNPDETAWVVRSVKFTGSVDAVFSQGPFTFHGKTYAADHCWAYLEFYYSSSRVAILDYLVAL